jgi:hypothetical protein
MTRAGENKERLQGILHKTSWTTLEGFLVQSCVGTDRLEWLGWEASDWFWRLAVAPPYWNHDGTQTHSDLEPWWNTDTQWLRKSCLMAGEGTDKTSTLRCLFSPSICVYLVFKDLHQANYSPHQNITGLQVTTPSGKDNRVASLHKW